MDPVSAISLLAAVSSLIKASNSLVDVMKTLKNTEKELLELYNDVLVFAEALKGFDRVLRSRQTRHNISTKVIENALEEGFSTVQDLEHRLVQLSKSEVLALRRIKWAQQKSSITKIHERLKGQNTMLQSFLALTHTETFLAVCKEYPQFLQVCSTGAEGKDTDALSVQTSIASESTTLFSGSSASSLRRKSVDTTASSLASSSTSLRRLSLGDSSASSLPSNDDDAEPTYGKKARLNPSLPSSTQPQPPLIRITDVEDQTTPISKQKSQHGPPESSILSIRRACRYDCYCDCHSQKPSVSGSKKSKLIASKGRCTEPTCKAVALQEKISPPSTFFRKAISQVLTSNSIKIRYDLNTFRMVSEGSDAIRYIKHGNLERLKVSMQTGEATLWDTSLDGWSLLHNAAYYRQLPIVQYLIELGADTEVTDLGTRKPADLALLKSIGADATHIEKEILNVFSKEDDYTVDFEFTPIHIAVLEIYDSSDRERPSLEKLIELVDDANNAPAGTDWAKWKLRYRKRSPLFGDIIEFFRASAAEKPKNHKIIHNLIDQRDRKYCWTPLHWASSAGRIDKMKILMSHGANPFLLSSLDANILHAAAESKALAGLAEALEIWRRHPQQLNINQANRWAETPLHVASWASFGCVNLLLQAGADRNARQEDRQVPLHCAGLSERGEVRRDIVALLCAGDDGPHINAQDVDGRPPIFEFLDDTECMEILINIGAALDLIDVTGKNISHHACIQNEADALGMILHSSPDSIIKTDYDGNTPLLLALKNSSKECAMAILILSNVGAIQGQDGWATIHWAVKWGDVDVVEAVLDHSSFVKGAVTDDGKTVEVVAMEAGNWCGAIKDLVRKHNSIT